MKGLLFGAATCALLVVSAACSREAKWKVKGNVEGAAGQTIQLEASGNGRWYVLDSTKVAADGAFSFEQPAAAYPGIYRVSLGGQSAFFPIDSAETISLTANAAAFATSYTLTGSEGAEMMTKVNSLMARGGANDSLKRDLSNLILADPASITAYYAISGRGSDGKLIYDPAVKSDLRMIGAVANAYSERRPGDPRTDYLTRLYLGHKQAQAGATRQAADTLAVDEIAYYDIELMDENGQTVKLSDVVARGPVLVSFTRYAADYSPALNIELSSLLDRYASKGLQIYQIGFDNDEFDWRQAAKNLPWTTVFNSPKDGDAVLMRYNVGQLPTTFIINGRGELVERVIDPTALDAAIRKSL